MTPMWIVLFLIVASLVIFFASLLNLFRSDLPKRAKRYFLIAAICTFPWTILCLGMALEPQNALFAYVYILFAPILALIAFGAFLLGRFGNGNWRTDLRSLGVSALFCGLVYLLARPNW